MNNNEIVYSVLWDNKNRNPIRTHGCRAVKNFKTAKSCAKKKSANKNIGQATIIKENGIHEIGRMVFVNGSYNNHTGEF